MHEENIVMKFIKLRDYNSYYKEMSLEIVSGLYYVLKQTYQIKKLKDITEFHIPVDKVYLSPMNDCFDSVFKNWTTTFSYTKLVNTLLGQVILSSQESEKAIVHAYHCW